MLDGNNFLQAGWINSLKLHVFGPPDQLKFVVMGNVRIYLNSFSNLCYKFILQVKHSQRMSDTPLIRGQYLA